MKHRRCCFECKVKSSRLNINLVKIIENNLTEKKEKKLIKIRRKKRKEIVSPFYFMYLPHLREKVFETKLLCKNIKV